MGLYAYPIEIKREPQMTREHLEFEITQPITIAYIESLGIDRDTVFSISESDWDDRESVDKIIVDRKRLETPEEVASRVASEELYMAHYTEYHAAPDSDTRLSLLRSWHLLSER